MILNIRSFDENTKYTLTQLIKLYFEEIDQQEVKIETIERYINDIEKQLQKYSSLKFLVAVNNSVIQGFIFGNTNYFYNDENCAFILELYVFPKYRFKGIGKLLVEEFEKITDKSIYLTAHKMSEIFYISIGYKDSGFCDVDNGNKVFKKQRL